MVTRPSQAWHFVAPLRVVRWVTCVALWVVVFAVWLLPHLDLPLRTIAPLGLLVAVMRTALELSRPRRDDAPRWLLGLALAAETALLAGLLDITGGLFNPFLVLYGVYIWLAVTVLSRRWGILVAAVAVAGLGWLVFDHLHAESAEHHRLNDFPTHLFTMWIAAAAVTELAMHYVSRNRNALAERQRLLDEAQARAARSERLAALTTLAAGAAHELSTPLATIAVAARELELSAARIAGVAVTPDARIAALGEDARLIRVEVDRCQGILDGMSGRAVYAGQDMAGQLPPAAIAQLAQERLTEAQRHRLRLEIAADAEAPSAAGIEVVQTVSSLLKNAFDASAPLDDVTMRMARSGSMLRIEVCDRGAGMSEEARQRAGEPFYTTKAPGRGTGLGLFLARTFAERSGGTLTFDGQGGTTAILELPLQPAGAAS